MKIKAEKSIIKHAKWKCFSQNIKQKAKSIDDIVRSFTKNIISKQLERLQISISVACSPKTQIDKTLLKRFGRKLSKYAADLLPKH